MQLLQAAMPAATRLALSAQPSEIEPRLRKVKWISGVSLWHVPLEAILYRIGLSQKAARDQELAKGLHRAGRAVRPVSSAHQSPQSASAGRFENEDGKPGARSLYFSAASPTARSMRC